MYTLLLLVSLFASFVIPLIFLFCSSCRVKNLLVMLMGHDFINALTNSPQSIVVFDLTGKQLITETLNAGKQLNINNLESGVYFVRVNDLVSNEVLVKKLSVQ